ncbi:hypothetical protein IMG5_098120 [Ichthyophthirius multifiliis]|uniref:UDP-N-acetylglucosamine diphosphorylase n=1 Tax=Ichthyophthirius multifiliis TaxID=5932 RepID=G0QS17_ICHMU|nr:hypothetical protein IMG5_098120 [Ichthyophthirius multifiliis]EGR31986.1 hypothetical protein IMG5_098120 [Ichthyophthirius multifiliis]|eukprot:XP_004035472.1 hypothetical protein IMG5_098120 [Ichthyophthirius multifiliis]
MGQCKLLNKSYQEISDIHDVPNLDFNRNSTYKKLEQISNQITTERGISNIYNVLISRIVAVGQLHLIETLRLINDQEQKNKFIEHLNCIDYETVDSLYHFFQNKDEILDEISYAQNIEKIENIKKEQYIQYFQQGLQMIKNKEVALVILAGGNNIRFDQKVQKSTCNIGLPSKLSVFEIIGKKLQVLQNLVYQNISTSITKCSFQIMIMINTENYFEIKKVWKNNDFFGFDEKDVLFMTQSMLPIIDIQGKIIMRTSMQCYEQPEGPGDIIKTIFSNKVIEKLLIKNYKYLHIIGVENLLVKPLDPLFLGYANENKNDINSKCVKLQDLTNEFFKLININGRLYIEL